MQPQFALVDIGRLRPHERTQPRLLAKVLDEIRGTGYVRRALLVESEHLVILDGHHRYEALLRLGCVRAPAFLVDYKDDGIGLTTWPDATVKSVTKAEVVDRGLRGDPFPPKTTRHLVGFDLEDIRIPLDDLR